MLLGINILKPRMNKTKETKRRKKSYSYYGTGEWKLEPITEWQIRMWIDDFRGLIHRIYLALLVIIILLIILICH